jgi:methionyl-tRNA synthetase
MASPFIPGKAQSIWAMLGLEGDVASLEWAALERRSIAGRTVRSPEVLFPKLAAV